MRLGMTEELSAMKQVTYEIKYSFNLSKKLQRFKYPCGDCSPEILHEELNAALT